jgi:hypothetical protein
MRFLPIDSTYDPLAYKNLSKLNFNLLKIKYFYEEDKLKFINSIPQEILQEIYFEEYMKIANEMNLFSYVLLQLMQGKKSEMDSMEVIETIIEVFLEYEAFLQDDEVEDEEAFLSWIKNGEFSLEDIKL